MSDSSLTRRSLLTSSTFLAAGIGLTSRSVEAQTMTGVARQEFAVYDPENPGFEYEVTRTVEEWKEHLGHDEIKYGVMRQAKTERPKSTDMWKEAHNGDYHCAGCDLPLYEGRWFQPLDKGWVFFHHAKVNSVLFGLDGPVPQYGQVGMALNEQNAIAEVHCRQCGSHIGHHLKVSGMFLHCINGNALTLA